MCNYWLYRISHWANASYPLLGEGYLTIRLSDVLNDKLDFASKVQNNAIDFDA